MPSSDTAADRVDVAVVGAGLAGLTIALRLAEAGLKVRVVERYPRPGGLARVLDIGGEPIEAFYHHLFTTDSSYIALAVAFNVAARHVPVVASRDLDPEDGPGGTVVVEPPSAGLLRSRWPTD